MEKDTMYPGMDDDEMSEGKEKPGMEKEDMGGETALLSKSMFGNHDPKVGEEYVFKVKRVHQDEVEVEYAPEKGSKEHEEEESPESKLNAMGSENPKRGGY
jgi:hypothetical protein